MKEKELHIQFEQNASFTVSFNGQALSFQEAEELSYLFIEQFLSHSKTDGAFSFGFPFDMIGVDFKFDGKEHITIGWEYYDESHKEELTIPAKEFFLELKRSLEDYFHSIEKQKPLDKYIIDNNPSRNSKRKWNWEMVERLNLCT